MFPFKGIAGAESGLSPKCMEKRHDMLVFLFPDELQGCSSGALGTEKAVSTVYSVGKVRKKKKKGQFLQARSTQTLPCESHSNSCAEVTTVTQPGV